jgi:hypothetical protein
VIILATFLEKLFAKPLWKLSVVIAFVSFIFSIVAAFVCMGMAANRVYYLGKPDDSTNRIAIWSGVSSLAFFLTGIIAMIVFALRNFYA